MLQNSEANWKQIKPVFWEFTNRLLKKCVMGNCESLSSTATASVTVKNNTVVNGSEEAAMIYSNGMITGTKVSVSFYYPMSKIAIF